MARSKSKRAARRRGRLQRATDRAYVARAMKVLERRRNRLDISKSEGWNPTQGETKLQYEEDQVQI